MASSRSPWRLLLCSNHWPPVVQQKDAKAEMTDLVALLGRVASINSANYKAQLEASPGYWEVSLDAIWYKMVTLLLNCDQGVFL